MEKQPKPLPSSEMGGKPPRKTVGTGMMDSGKVTHVLEIMKAMNLDEMRELHTRVVSELLP